MVPRDGTFVYLPQLNLAHSAGRLESNLRLSRSTVSGACLTMTAINETPGADPSRAGLSSPAPGQPKSEPGRGERNGRFGDVMASISNFLERNITSLANSGLRATSILLRFILILFITRHMGLESVGAYGLAQSLLGPAPAILGLGINYFLARDLVHMPLADASLVLRDRIVLSAALCSAACIILLPAWIWLGMQSPSLVLAIASLCCLEVVGYDFQISFNAVQRTILASLLYFFRSSAWTPIIFIGYFAFGFDISLKTIFDIWIAFNLIGYAGAMVVLWRWAGRGLLTTPVSFGRFITTARKGWYIFINDLSNAMSVNLDRYIIALFLGLREVGAYSFFWAFANAALTLTAAGTIQAEAPDLVRIRTKEHSHVDWVRLAKRFTQRVAAYGFFLCGLSAVAGALAATLIKGDEMRPYLWLSFAMAGNQWLAAISIGLGNVLTSVHDDQFIAGSNITMVIGYAILLPLAAHYGGLVGMVIFITASIVTLLASRAWRVRTFF